MMLEVGQEAEFYMVANNLPSTWGGGGGSGHLAVCIVRPLPRGLVVVEHAVAAGAMSVVEECLSGGGSRGEGGAAVRVILMTRSLTVTATRTVMATGQPHCGCAGCCRRSSC